MKNNGNNNLSEVTEEFDGVDVESGIMALVRRQTLSDSEMQDYITSAIDCRGLLSKKDAETYKCVVLGESKNAKKRYRVGCLSSTSIEDKNQIPRLLKTYSFGSLEFIELEIGRFDLIMQAVYSAQELVTGGEEHSAKNAADEVFGSGSSSFGFDASKIGDTAFQDRAGEIVDLTDMERYQELREKFKNKNISDGDLQPFDFIVFLLQDFYFSEGSDLHVKGSGKIKYRIDGEMRTKWEDIATNEIETIANCLCIMASTTPSEMTRQGVQSVIPLKVKVDGRIKTSEMRFQSVNSMGAPSIILRSQQAPITDMNQIGYQPYQTEAINKGLAVGENIILITGATGSGKTNSQFSMLHELSEDGTKCIYEAGDPIEIRTKRWEQLMIRTPDSASAKAISTLYRRTFANLLRADPDIIAFSEIRDADIAALALRAANSGHLVLSTLHAGTVEKALTTLINFEMRRDLIADGVGLICAQKLVKKLCPVCRVVDEDNSRLSRNKIFMASDDGCEVCGWKGTWKRTAVAEVLLMDTGIRRKLVSGASPAEVIKYATESKRFVPIRQVALEKVNSGEVSKRDVDFLLNELAVDESRVESDELEFVDGEEIIEGEYEGE